MSEEAEEMLEVEGEQVSLADIAGVVMDDVEEVRGFTFPKGLFSWEVVEAKLGVRNSKNGDTAVAAFKLKCIDVATLVDDTIDPADMIGKNYTETFWIKELASELGRIKAFMADAGYSGSGNLQNLMEGMVGHEFVAKITHQKSKDDKDVVYANLDRRSVTPMTASAEEAVEEAEPAA